VLLDPFEEEFDLPATPKQFGDGQCREREVVGLKDEAFVLFGIEIANAP